MAKLSSAIVQRKLATLRDVEEALARQVLYGGDLATNLLEQAPGMDERALTALLAETQSMAPAPSGPLPRAPSDTLTLVPGDVALRHGLYPLERSGGSLIVAVSEPMKPEVEQDIAFGLGLTIVQRVAPLVRVKEAISRDYGVPLDRRSQRVLAKLEGRPDPSPSLTPAPLSGVPDIGSLPRPPSIPPLGLPAPTDMTPLYGGGPGAIPALRPLPQVTIREPAPDTPVSNAAGSIYDRLTSPAPAEAAGRSVPATPTLRADPGLEAERRPSRPPAEADRRPSRPPADAERRPSRPPGDGDRRSRPPSFAPPPQEGGARRRSRPPSVAPNAAETPLAVRRPSQGKLPVQRTDLGAWSAQNKQSERRPRSRHRGPYTAAAAEEDLLNADSRDTVLTALFDFACQYFEYSALFAVHGDLAEGRSAHGPGADHAKITGIGVPLDMPGALATARREGHFTVQALARDGLDAQLTRDLERRSGKKVLLLPILVRGRCVLIFYGDDGEEDVDLSQIGDVLAFAPLVASALENVIRKKKASLRQTTVEFRPVSAGPLPRHKQPTREERREALAAALETTLRRASSRPPPRSSRPPPVPPRSRPTPPASPQARQAVLGHPPVDDGSRVTPQQGTSTVGSVPPGSGPVFELRTATEAELLEEDERLLPATEPPAAPEEGPEISVSATEEDWSPELVGIPPLPDSQVVVPATRPVRPHSSAELRLPSIIVNMDGDLEGLVAKLVAGDTSVVDRIATMGASAASFLVARFPGPIREADRLAVRELASNRGPILLALARIGQPAAPFLSVRSNDRDATVRMWATSLLGEIPSVDSATAVSRRVADSSAEVRRAAIDAGKLLQSNDDARTALRDKVLSLAESTASIESRVAAIEAIAHFRDGRSVPRLVRLLGSKDEVGQSAEWALGVLTRQSFGRDIPAWERGGRSAAARTASNGSSTPSCTTTPRSAAQQGKS
jgi:hypothetical protein